MKRDPLDRVTIAAKAKVTLSLRVLGTRSDGYHDLEALTVSATDPDDVIRVSPSPRPGVTVRVRPARAAPAGRSNLAARAAEALLPHLSVTGLRIRLDKDVPAGAGLGGGSSDAAAVLRLLAWRFDIPDDHLHEIAAELGSDVPFCLQRLPALMRGRGEVLEAVPDLAPVDLVIVAPPFPCSTPAVYGAWDALGGPRSDREIDAPATVPGPFVNDLEPAAERVEPRLRAFRERLETILGRPALLCGSGSAYAAWFADTDSAEAGAHRAQVAFGVNRAWHARTIHE